ncbi:membrane protein [Paucimonas lemoignei]|uniref:Membrane protein n=1 Tax=Paucimonas lemoignei TaxID=29443 RepID=A0A4R3I3P8_PAULE|nr:YihY/virulence factor BrkB family protein [Paucimonas lemoignei]TCS39325.1 membrane protein [Paucimonas lemoignei]
MKTSSYFERGNTPPGTLQVAAALLSFIVVLTRGSKDNRRTRQLPAQPAADVTARSELSDATQKKNKEVASLRSESKPKALFHIAISAAKEWVAHRASSKGAALALYTLFSLAPMLVLVVTIAGLFFGEDTVRNQLLQQMSGMMGEQGGEGVRTILAGTKQENAGVIAGLISAGLVLVSATSAFSELKDSLDELWEVPPSKESGIWSVIRQRVLSFGVILVVALMLMISLAVSTALAAMDSIWPGGDGSPLKIISVVISHLISFGIVTALFAVIFKYLPATKIAWKDVIVGALITATLFIIGKTAIGIYVANADIGSAYGAAGSVVIMILWVYYSAQIFFYGSLFTHEYAMKLGSRADATDVENLPNSSMEPGERARLLRTAH